jgi:aarF domain-containing kinase
MQLVLLDHGLYKTIDDQFRADYAALWRSLIFAGGRQAWALRLGPPSPHFLPARILSPTPHQL